MIQCLPSPCDIVFTGCRPSLKPGNCAKPIGWAKWMCRPCAVFPSACKKASSSRLWDLRAAASPRSFICLGGLTRADSGSVTIDGVDFATLSDGERTRLRKSKIGFVFQKFNLLPTLSARSNIEIAVTSPAGHARSRIPEQESPVCSASRNVWSIGRTSFPAASSRESR
jgi:hypothetical protein